MKNTLELNYTNNKGEVITLKSDCSLEDSRIFLSHPKLEKTMQVSGIRGKKKLQENLISSIRKMELVDDDKKILLKMFEAIGSMAVDVFSDNLKRK